MDIKTALARVVEQIDLSTEEMREVMRDIMTGQCTDAQIGAFLVGLRMKGESIDEITGAAMVMRELASGVEVSGERVVDTCGTGGDGANIFNVSTAAALVVAAAGGKVAKHGNRAVSGKSGSADLLEAAGVNLALTPEQVGRCVEAVGVGFMFAPAHHSAMKHAVGPRKSATAFSVKSRTRTWPIGSGGNVLSTSVCVSASAMRSRVRRGAPMEESCVVSADTTPSKSHSP